MPHHITWKFINRCPKPTESSLNWLSRSLSRAWSNSPQATLNWEWRLDEVVINVDDTFGAFEQIRPGSLIRLRGMNAQFGLVLGGDVNSKVQGALVWNLSSRTVGKMSAADLQEADVMIDAKSLSLKITSIKNKGISSSVIEVPEAGVMVDIEYLCEAVTLDQNKLCIRNGWSMVYLDTSPEAMEAFGVKGRDRFFFKPPCGMDFNKRSSDLKSSISKTLQEVDKVLQTLQLEEPEIFDEPYFEEPEISEEPIYEDYHPEDLTVIGYEATTQRLWVRSDSFSLSSYTLQQWNALAKQKLPKRLDGVFSYESIKEFCQLETALYCFPNLSIEILRYIINDENKRRTIIQKFSHLYTLLIRFPMQAPTLVRILLQDENWFAALMTQFNPPKKKKSGPKIRVNNIQENPEAWVNCFSESSEAELDYILESPEEWVNYTAESSNEWINYIPESSEEWVDYIPENPEEWANYIPGSEFSFDFIETLFMSLNLIRDRTVENGVKLPLLRGLCVLHQYMVKASKNQPQRSTLLEQFRQVFCYWHDKLSPLKTSLSQSCPSYTQTPHQPPLSASVNQNTAGYLAKKPEEGSPSLLRSILRY